MLQAAPADERYQASTGRYTGPETGGHGRYRSHLGDPGWIGGAS